MTSEARLAITHDTLDLIWLEEKQEVPSSWLLPVSNRREEARPHQVFVYLAPQENLPSSAGLTVRVNNTIQAASEYLDLLARIRAWGLPLEQQERLRRKFRDVTRQFPQGHIWARGLRAQRAADLPVTSLNAADPLQELRLAPQGLQNPPVTQKSDCRSCQWRAYCAGGCPLLSQRINGQFDSRSPYCELYQFLFPRLLRLEALRLISQTDGNTLNQAQ